jgi:hypothetical protein
MPRSRQGLVSMCDKRPGAARSRLASSRLRRILGGHFPRRPHCLAGVVGLEPANPFASYLIGIASQLRLRGRKPGGGDPSCASSVTTVWPLRFGFARFPPPKKRMHHASEGAISLTAARVRDPRLRRIHSVRIGERPTQTVVALVGASGQAASHPRIGGREVPSPGLAERASN